MAYEANKNNLPLQDDSMCPSGKYKEGGPDPRKMIDVPATYLMYVYDNDMAGARVKNYIERNKDVILKQAKENGYASRE